MMIRKALSTTFSNVLRSTVLSKSGVTHRYYGNLNFKVIQHYFHIYLLHKFLMFF